MYIFFPRDNCCYALCNVHAEITQGFNIAKAAALMLVVILPVSINTQQQSDL